MDMPGDRSRFTNIVRSSRCRRIQAYGDRRRQTVTDKDGNAVLEELMQTSANIVLRNHAIILLAYLPAISSAFCVFLLTYPCKFFMQLTVR